MEFKETPFPHDIFDSYEIVFTQQSFSIDLEM